MSVFAKELYSKIIHFIDNYSSFSLLDVIFPYSCHLCGIYLAEGAFCSACWPKLELLDFPACPRCFFQFPFEVGSKCGKCEVGHYYCDSIRSPIRYNEAAKALLLRFKNGNQSGISSILANMMLRLIPEFEFDCVVAIPLHRLRRIWRGYNQSELLAREICAITGKPNLSHLLIRSRFTSSQGNFGKSDRIKNIKNAFQTVSSFRNMRVLLIDDVCTTGSTLEECAKELKKAGAEKVHSITAAMT